MLWNCQRYWVKFGSVHSRKAMQWKKRNGMMYICMFIEMKITETLLWHANSFQWKHFDWCDSGKSYHDWFKQWHFLLTSIKINNRVDICMIWGYSLSAQHLSTFGQRQRQQCIKKVQIWFMHTHMSTESFL